MRRKRIRGWVAILLPILLWRALIPIGFMPMIGKDHRVSLVICDSYATLPDPLMSMPMDAGMDMSHPTQGGGSPVHQDHGACLYGSSPALGALPTLAIAPVVLYGTALRRVDAPQPGFIQAPSRAHFARGPPV